MPLTEGTALPRAGGLWEPRGRGSAVGIAVRQVSALFVGSRVHLLFVALPLSRSFGLHCDEQQVYKKSLCIKINATA